ncbi:unnamed protein product [Anisakis simplex]|uniref:Uncharacterized protein n=1 Tax=Anisakis simplex TaxID=6269 RepID=A0A0M3JQF8_ANISI|nr:unnamed protein product [Anisakis simplex]
MVISNGQSTEDDILRSDGTDREYAVGCEGAYLDFVDEECVSIGNGFQSSPNREGGDLGTGGHEEACLIQGIFNSYKAYEAGLYQVYYLLLLFFIVIYYYLLLLLFVFCCIIIVIGNH